MVHFGCLINFYFPWFLSIVLYDSKYRTKENRNRPFPSFFEPHYSSEAKCKVFIMKINFFSYANKTNFHMKNFALGLAFTMRFTVTRKWPIEPQRMCT